jgi:iron(III) transport system ATP-binding protein
MAMLEQVSMTAFAQAYPHTLSGGQQQRVALARALAPEPKLLLLDEPFSGLDTSMREKIRHDMLGVLKQSGVATMMVTHDPEEAMYMADRIKILGGGEVQQAGRPHDIYYKPEDEFVARLFGLINVIEGVVEGSTVSTPFGAVEARGHENGAPVRVLIRPEGIVLESSGAGAEGCPIEVVSTHLLGHGSIVRIQVSDGADGGEEFQVRVHKEFTPELDGTILARIDPAHAFVFPAAAATESGARHGFRPTVLEGGARPGAAGEAGKGDRGTTVAAE